MARSPRQSIVPFSVRARRRWTSDDARLVLDRFEASGLTVGEFAAREGLDPQRLYRWRAQLGSAGALMMPAFVEIKAPAAALELVLGSGHVVRVPAGFDEETLRRLVATLEARTGC